MEENNINLINSQSIHKSVFEQDIEKKQNIIKTSIIDKNYDKNLFFNFCMDKKEQGGEDLSNWTIEELTSTINEFVEAQNKVISNKKTLEQEYQKQKEMAHNLHLNINEINNNYRNSQNLQMNYALKNIPFIKEFYCNALQKSFLNVKEIKVTIKNPKAIEVGFFASSYIIYEIETIIIKDKIKFKVTRRYSDFINLRNALQKQFPYYLIPPLPGKKFGLRRFDYDFVMKRMAFLNKFISDLIKIEEFKTSEFLISFLSCQDRNQFKLKMKEINYIPEPPIYIENIKTLSGKIRIYNENNINDNYFTNVQNYFILQNQFLEKLNESLRKFYKTMISAFTNLEDAQKYFELLHSLNSQVHMKEDIVKSYEQFEIFFKNWKNVVFNQNDIIRKKIKDFFKYVKMEVEGYLELYTKRNEIQDKYIKENNRLQNKKDKLWAQMDISKWEIIEDFSKIDNVLLIKDKIYAYSKMCTTETNNLINLEKKLGYVNNCCIEELKKLVDKYKNTFVDNIKDFSEDLYPIINDSLNVWSQIASSIEDKKNR